MKLPCVFSICVLLALPCTAQTAAPPTAAPDDYSGMYSFLKDGEFMQVTIEEQNKVSGFISRYGDTASDKDAFMDQFFKSGTANGKQLTFTTESVHGVSFSFTGSFDRGPGKKPEDEAYYVLRGTLTRTATAPDGKESVQVRQVEFKSFPRDASAP